MPPMTARLGGNRRLVLAWLAIGTLSVIVAAVLGLASSWDGATYLWTTLDRQIPFTPNLRFINVGLQVPLLLASRFTADSWLLETVFGLSYAAVPLIVLAGSIWAIGWNSRLLVWPAMSIGFAAVMATSNATSEATMAALLFWPALLAMLARRSPGRSLVAIGLAAVSIVAHPFAIGTLGACAVVAMVGRSWRWALVFVIGAAAGIGRLIWFSVPYETSQVGGESLALVVPYLNGLHPVGFILAFAAGVIVLVASRWRVGHATTIVAALTTTATACFLIWAANPDSVADSLYLRTATPVLVAPFALLAVLDAWLPTQSREQTPTRSWGIGLSMSAVAFLLVTTSQAAHWSSYRDAVRAKLASSSVVCIPLETMPHMPGWVGSFWTETQYSLTLQGRIVTRIAEPAELCDSGVLADQVPTSHMLPRQYGEGWFNLEALRGP